MENTATSWGWAGPSSAQTGTGTEIIYFIFDLIDLIYNKNTNGYIDCQKHCLPLIISNQLASTTSHFGQSKAPCYHYPTGSHRDYKTSLSSQLNLNWVWQKEFHDFWMVPACVQCWYLMIIWDKFLLVDTAWYLLLVSDHLLWLYEGGIIKWGQVWCSFRNIIFCSNILLDEGEKIKQIFYLHFLWSLVISLQTCRKLSLIFKRTSRKMTTNSMHS